MLRKAYAAFEPPVPLFQMERPEPLRGLFFVTISEVAEKQME